MTYYKKPYQREYADNYHNGLLKAEIDLKENIFIKVRNDCNKNILSHKSLAEYHYNNGYFCYICQYASDNKLI